MYSPFSTEYLHLQLRVRMQWTETAIKEPTAQKNRTLIPHSAQNTYTSNFESVALTVCNGPKPQLKSRRHRKKTGPCTSVATTQLRASEKVRTSQALPGGAGGGVPLRGSLILPHGWLAGIPLFRTPARLCVYKQ